MISLAEKHPELENEWDDSNEPITPWNVSYGSNKKVRWKGICGHTWEAIIKNRANGHGCPICTGNRVVEGINDFASQSPEIAKEWSEKNPDEPTDYTNHSPHLAWWKCLRCGYEWQARIADRVTKGSGCSNCLGRIFTPGVNDFATEHPDIAAEWSDRNRDLKPDSVWSRSRQKVWWKCKTCGYEWQAVIDSRIKGHNPCPSCADMAVNPGFNDLETVCPELAAEWDYELNKGLTPDNILASSMKPVFWKDYYGHRWWAKLSNRMAGEGCPYCLRDNYYLFKLKSIAYYVNREGLSTWFRDQSEIGIPLELYIPEKKVAIEFYGTKYDNGEIRQYENGKNWVCINAGIKLIRVIPPGQKEFDNCICITLTEDTIHSYKYALRHILKIAGIKTDIDIERDADAINGTVLTEGVHNEEADDENNTTGTWNTVMAGNMLPHKPKTRRI